MKSKEFKKHFGLKYRPYYYQVRCLKTNGTLIEFENKNKKIAAKFAYSLISGELSGGKQTVTAMSFVQTRKDRITQPSNLCCLCTKPRYAYTKFCLCDGCLKKEMGLPKQYR